MRKTLAAALALAFLLNGLIAGSGGVVLCMDADGGTHILAQAPEPCPTDGHSPADCHAPSTGAIAEPSLDCADCEDLAIEGEELNAERLVQGKVAPAAPKLLPCGFLLAAPRPAGDAFLVDPPDRNTPHSPPTAHLFARTVSLRL